MFTYLLNRWIISRRFEKVEGGYIYRRRADLPGFEVTDDERRETLREFRRRYWKFWLLIPAGLLVGALGLFLITAAFELDQGFIKAANYVLVIGILIFVLWEQRKWSLLPERMFSTCPRVEPEVAAGGWFDRFQRMMSQRSWPSHLISNLVNGAIAWLLTPKSLDVGAGHWFLFVIFAMGAITSAFGVICKARARGE